MSVIIRDINWEETEANLFVHISMKGAKASKLDVLSSGQYLQVGAEENQLIFTLIPTIGLLCTVLLRSVSLQSGRR